MNVSRKINSDKHYFKLRIATITIVVVLYANFNMAETPPLGVVSDFAIFTKTGAISNVGLTTITGNLGADVGAITGFPPGIINGSINSTNSITIQGAIDVENAFTFLINATCDSIIGTTLGVNQILTPNVYCLGAAATLTGDLILDGLGDPNALFIIKIDGAFTTSVFSNIILINSTSPCNVYWQVNGLFSLGDNSTFKGTVITNGAINLLDGSSLEGRALSRAGAITLSNTTITSTCNETFLPIELVSFNSVCDHQNAILNWSTLTENNNDYFIIERSKDAINWKTIGRVDAAGTSYTLKNYSYNDKEQTKEAKYYRLKQTDFNRDFKYMSIVFLKDCSESLIELGVYPNPGNGVVKLSFKGNEELFVSAAIYNSFGEEVYESKTYQTEIDLSDKSAGVYFLHFKLNSETIIKKLVVEKL